MTNFVNLYPKTAVHFAAQKYATVTLPKTSLKLDIYRLGADKDDIAFLHKGLDLIQKEEKTPGSESMVPVLPSVDRENYFELVKTGFERSIDVLSEQKSGLIKIPPVVLAAVSSDNRELAGLELVNIERTLTDDSRMYTPLKHHLEADKTTTSVANHSSINWLFTLTPVRGVGLALTSALRFPKSVKRIDLISEDPACTPQAQRLYSGLGFTELPDLVNEKPIPRKLGMPVKTFKQMHGIPMTVVRSKFDNLAKKVRKTFQFKLSKSKKEINLLETVNFPSHKISS